jgi:NAD(P)-dependent dehydrogenase (short-subunit alcohol dehydrogenase family)
MNRLRDGIAGRTALVTGANRGLGLHFARTLAEAGARVATAARRVESLGPHMEDFGRAAMAVELDVNDPASVEAAVGTVMDETGSIDILVNNAGILVARPLLEQSREDWARVIDTDLTGAWHVAQQVARAMAEAGRGSIVNVASISGIRGGDWVPGYVAAKAGLIRLTEVMAMELAPRGVRVNALAPGYVATDMSAEFFSSSRGRDALSRVPMGRPARPQELEGPLLLLAGDSGSYMTGTTLVVDGGALVSKL